MPVVCSVLQNAYMQKKEAAVTIRLPAALKRRLEARARAQHRSLSAQVLVDLERDVSGQLPDGNAKPGRFLGLFQGSAAPTESDFAEVRRLLWSDVRRLERRG